MQKLGLAFQLVGDIMLLLLTISKTKQLLQLYISIIHMLCQNGVNITVIDKY